jgi:hypothetical protein
MKNGRGVRELVTEPAKRLDARSLELQECQTKLNALLESYGASLQVTQVMQLQNGEARYSYQISLANRV